MILETLGGYCTLGAAARMFGGSYWSVRDAVKRGKIQTVTLAGSKTVLVSVAQIAAIVSKSGK